MPFQFLCPQGHLLEGDEAHMGMATQCPHCGMTFIIPTMHAQPEPQPEPAAEFDVYNEPFVAEPHSEPVVDSPAVAELLQEMSPDQLAEADQQIVHIPCPNGHELETPFDMIGQEVLCPHCGVQFRLRNEDSVEYARERDRIDAIRGQFWFRWSIATAVVVLLGLVAMIVVMAMD